VPPPPPEDALSGQERMDEPLALEIETKPQAEAGESG
jgi:hypothetical protein